MGLILLWKIWRVSHWYLAKVCWNLRVSSISGGGSASELTDQVHYLLDREVVHDFHKFATNCTGIEAWKESGHCNLVWIHRRNPVPKWKSHPALTIQCSRLDAIQLEGSDNWWLAKCFAPALPRISSICKRQALRTRRAESSLLDPPHAAVCDVTF